MINKKFHFYFLYEVWTQFYSPCVRLVLKIFGEFVSIKEHQSYISVIGDQFNLTGDVFVEQQVAGRVCSRW